MALAKKKRAAAKPKKAAAKTKKVVKAATKTKKVAKAAPKASKKHSVKNPMTKSELFRDIAECTGLTTRQVSAVFQEFSSLIEAHISKSGPGLMKVPGLMKIMVKERPATKARKGINPFTGEEIMIKAKPKSLKVRILPLKALKEMVK